jgi:hypothetical protein
MMGPQASERGPEGESEYLHRVPRRAAGILIRQCFYIDIFLCWALHGPPTAHCTEDFLPHTLESTL